jgi:hypothetical protein
MRDRRSFAEATKRKWLCGHGTSGHTRDKTEINEITRSKPGNVHSVV